MVKNASPGNYYIYMFIKLIIKQFSKIIIIKL